MPVQDILPGTPETSTAAFPEAAWSCPPAIRGRIFLSAGDGLKMGGMNIVHIELFDYVNLCIFFKRSEAGGFHFVELALWSKIGICYDSAVAGGGECPDSFCQFFLGVYFISFLRSDFSRCRYWHIFHFISSHNLHSKCRFYRRCFRMNSRFHTCYESPDQLRFRHNSRYIAQSVHWACNCFCRCYLSENNERIYGRSFLYVYSGVRKDALSGSTHVFFFTEVTKSE